MNDISFKSKIRPVCAEEFVSNLRRFDVAKQHVSAPWTVRQTVVDDKAFTTGVLDCTVCGITDGKKVLLMHLVPFLKENSDFPHIFNVIKKRLNGFNFDKTNLRGFLLGSKPDYSPGSEKIIDTLAKYMEERKIPYSMLKGGGYETHVAYSAETDEWLIHNQDITKDAFKYADPKAILERNFKEVKISHLDTIA